MHFSLDFRVFSCIIMSQAGHDLPICRLKPHIGKVALKLLFDGQFLARSVKKQQTGIFRVSDELFKRFAAMRDVELYFLMPNSAGGASEYLESIGRPDMADRIVRFPKLYATTKRHKLKHKLLYGFLTWVLTPFYRRRMAKFDVYFSPYQPISPIVYESGIKTAIIVHDLIPLLCPKFSGKLARESFVRHMDGIRADEVFCVSRSAQMDFLRYRTDYSIGRTCVAYPGVDARFKKTSARKIKGKYIFALSEGNPRKNFKHAIEAFARYLEISGDKETSLVIGGSMWKYHDPKETPSYEKIKSRVVFTGYIEDADLPALYSGASAFLYPSLYEGFGLPPLEAMACGTPVIAGNNSSMPEVCGDAALYVSGFDIDETANAIKQALNDKTLSQKGLARSKLFSWDKMADTIINKLKGLL
jgi:glycosyltransferase involved in cell wall biosynthesis